MENASKALIIAGAILLSIAIIGIGMSVYSGAEEAVKNANMSATEIQAFNSKFETYEGLRVSGSDVKSLIDTVRTHNNAYANDPSKLINLGSRAATNPAPILDAIPAIGYAELKQGIRTGRTYIVTIGYTQNGLVGDVGFVPNP